MSFYDNNDRKITQALKVSISLSYVFRLSEKKEKKVELYHCLFFLNILILLCFRIL